MGEVVSVEVALDVCEDWRICAVVGELGDSRFMLARLFLASTSCGNRSCLSSRIFSFRDDEAGT